MSKFSPWIATVLIPVSPSVAVGDLIHVPGDEPTIQAGIDAAVAGDEVVIGIGVYFENVDLLGKAITVRSTDPEAPEVVASTIIDGGGVAPVVRCVSGEGASTVLSGLVLRHGNGVGAGGGGLRTEGSSPVVSRCIFENNVSPAFEFGQRAGGGMSNLNGSPTVSECVFADNQDSALLNEAGDPVVIDCSFIGNVSSAGGGLCNVTGSPTVTRCVFDDNVAAFGGAVCDSDDAVFRECRFIDNAAEATSSGGGLGGGVCIFFGTATLIDCLFDGNSAVPDPFGGSGVGGGMYVGNGDPTLESCTFRNNVAITGAGGGLYVGLAGLAHVASSLFCHNEPSHVDGPWDDLGGNEFLADCPCPADLDGDGEVGVGDLLTILGAWGTPDGDVTGDGTTDVADLLAVLAAWGPCA